MTEADYDAIIDEGFGSWVERYYAERLPGVAEGFGGFVQSLPDAFAAWRDKGVVVFSPVVTTIPYEYFCGGRSMQKFMLDLHRRPDKVQAAMDASMPFLKEQMRQLIRRLAPRVWVGGWRSASEFLSPRRSGSASCSRTTRIWPRRVAARAPSPSCTSTPTGRATSSASRSSPRKCVLSLDGKTDIFKAKEVLGDHMCLMGDVPPRMLTLGTPEEVTDYCSKLIAEVGPGGFILQSGCDIPVDAKFENVKAMADAAADA